MAGTTSFARSRSRGWRPRSYLEIKIELEADEQRLPKKEQDRLKEKKLKLELMKIYGSDQTAPDTLLNLEGESLFGFTKLPEEQILPCSLENLPAALALINCARHGCGPKVQSLTVEKTGEPDHPAKVQVVRHCWRVFENWLQHSPV